MNADFINLTKENIADEHLCCIIRSRKPHAGIDAKRKWLSDMSFAKKFGFEVVDETVDGYELLALSLDGTTPRFADNAGTSTIESQELTVYKVRSSLSIMTCSALISAEPLI